VRGVVETFDEEVGLGTVVRLDGVPYPFHCTQIADGSRTINVGVTVEFDVMAGHRGQWEAAALRVC
jgi:cold shock CspA family protein